MIRIALQWTGRRRGSATIPFRWSLHPRVIHVRITAAAEGEDRIVTAALRRHQIVLHVAPQVVKVVLGPQVKSHATRRINPLRKKNGSQNWIAQFAGKMAPPSVMFFAARGSERIWARMTALGRRPFPDNGVDPNGSDNHLRKPTQRMSHFPSTWPANELKNFRMLHNLSLATRIPREHDNHEGKVTQYPYRYAIKCVMFNAQYK